MFLDSFNYKVKTCFCQRGKRFGFLSVKVLSIYQIIRIYTVIIVLTNRVCRLYERIFIFRLR